MSLLRLSVPARIAVGVVSSVAFASIGIEFAVRIEDSGVLPTLWELARYFTYLTSAALAVALGMAALRGRWPGTTLPAAISVWVAVTGIIYHVLLAQSHNPQGVQVLSNLGLHTLVPVGWIAVWITFCPKHGMSYLDPLVWTVWRSYMPSTRFCAGSWMASFRISSLTHRPPAFPRSSPISSVSVCSSSFRAVFLSC